MTTTLTNGDKAITLFTKPSCVQCTATYRALDEVSRIAPVATADGDIRP